MFPGEYLTRYGQGSVFTTDPCPNLVRYLPDFLKKKTKVLDVLDTDKRCFIRINIKSRPQDIWIRIHFLEKNGSPSLLTTNYNFHSQGLFIVLVSVCGVYERETD